MAHSLARSADGAGDGQTILWNIAKNCLELYPYIRQNNNIFFDDNLIFSNVPLNEWLNLRIEIKSDRYIFTYNGQSKEIVVNIWDKYNGTCQFNRIVGPCLWFGGTSPAPQALMVEYENFDAFVEYRLSNATQTWTVEYFDSDGQRIVAPLATADGGPSDNFTIMAKVGTPVVALGYVKF